MKKIPVDMQAGSIHETNLCGKLKVINYFGWDNVDVEFLSTGGTATTQASNISAGNVKDKMMPSVFDIGFFGSGKFKSRLNKVKTAEYIAWQRMLERCYCYKYQDKFPTYKDCTVCDEWLNFQAFAEWFTARYKDGYQLDKDIKVKGNKIYSPETCKLVSQKDNAEAAKALTYTMVNPNGELQEFYNMAQFCKDNGLDRNLMKLVLNGKNKQHKGWTKAVD